MLEANCTSCGARYRVSQENVGKRARCRRCGHVFAIADADPEASLLASGELELEKLAGGDPVAARPSVLDAAQPRAGIGAAAVEQTAEPTLGGMIGGYLMAVGLTPAVMFHTSSIATLAIVCVVYSLQVLAYFSLCLAPVVLAILNGWFLAYLLNVVVSGAANDDSLPGMSIEDGMFEGVVVPLLKFLAIALIAMAPVALVLGTAMSEGELEPVDAITTWARALGRDYTPLLELQAGWQAAAWAALAAGLVFQPIMLLVVAVGSIGSLARVDLMAATIMRTAPGYAILLVVGLAAGFSEVALNYLLAPDDDAVAKMGLGSWLGASFAVMCATVLVSVFQMRVTGLFYHHFKSRFAWSWG